MKLLVATAATAAMLFAETPAYAQINQAPEKTPLQELYEQQKKEQAEIEREYNATMKRTRGHTAPQKSDPWAGVRPSDNSGGKR